MSARPTHDLVVKNGEYEDRNSGETKARWLNIGTLFTHDDGGISVKLDCFPVGIPDWQGWAKAFPKKPRDEQGGGAGLGYPSQRYGVNQPTQQPRRSAPPPPPAATDFDDDIPF